MAQHLDLDIEWETWAEAGLQSEAATAGGDLGLAVEARHIPGLYERAVKPLIDRFLALALLVVLGPVLAVTALIVAANLGAPVLLHQQRIGLHGRPFRMLKFRTMLPDRRAADRRGASREDSSDRRTTHKTAADPRHTRVGRFLRKWSLDELPQLLNVLKGDMSLVGPRPELAQIVATYEPWQHSRHLVRPGLTGLWQVTERGSDELMCEHVDLDLRYIDEVSMRADLKIMLMTVPAALGVRKGS